jgi:hypothetical protein
MSTLARVGALLVICLVVIGLALAMDAPAFAWELEQQWTKPVGKGVTFYHFRLRFEQGPAHLYMLEVSPESGYTIRPVLANNRIGSLAPVEDLAKQVNAVAAINGGFFDTGASRLPVGLIKIDHRTVFEQFLPRPVLGIDSTGGIHFAAFELHSTLYSPEQDLELPLFGYNRNRKYGEIVAYSSEYGRATGTNVWGREFMLKRVSPQIAKEGEENYVGEKYLIVGENSHNSAIAGDELIVSLHSNAIRRYGDQLKGVYLGAEMEVRTNLPEGWERYPHLLGGGPMLVEEGQYVLDYKRERFSRALSTATARTAVGLTRSGKIALIVIDSGAPDYSVGATWHQLAIVGRDFLNAKHLMGFDGGGSSTMYVSGRVANRPQGGVPRSVANILAVVPRN